MPDDGGVLGNLPRSRPGQRSDKRSGPKAGDAPPDRAAKTTAKAASRAERSGSKAASPPPKTRPRPAAEEQPASRGGDPVTGAILGAAGLAATGARVAGGLARELLRRMPRP